MKRTLSLKREALADLTERELAGVAGGQLMTFMSCPLSECIPTMPPQCYSFPWC